MSAHAAEEKEATGIVWRSADWIVSAFQVISNELVLNKNSYLFSVNDRVGSRES